MIIYLEDNCSVCGTRVNIHYIGDIAVCYRCSRNCPGCNKEMTKNDLIECAYCGAQVCKDCLLDDGCRYCIRICDSCGGDTTEWQYCEGCNSTICFNCTEYAENGDPYCKECLNEYQV